VSREGGPRIGDALFEYLQQNRGDPRKIRDHHGAVAIGDAASPDVMRPRFLRYHDVRVRDRHAEKREIFIIIPVADMIRISIPLQ
jgi:hypothetical protein